MTAIDKKIDASSSEMRSDLSSQQVPFSLDSSAFLNWSEADLASEDKRVILFRLLVATVKFQPALDESLEAKALIFLKSVIPKTSESADAFLSNFASSTEESLTNFVQSIVVLISTPNQVLTTTALKILQRLIMFSSAKLRIPLVNTDLITHLINTLNTLSLSFTNAIDTHINLITIITNSVTLATPYALTKLEVKDHDGQQTVHETVLKQVLVPSEKYLRHLCTNRFSIKDGKQSRSFLALLTRILQISPYYQPTMQFVLHMPIFVTIASCLTFFEKDNSIFWFLDGIVDLQQGWNETRGEHRKTSKTVDRTLRMEGIEDVSEEKLRTEKNTLRGEDVVEKSIRWNNLLGVNLPLRW
ncbi:hypothetical protein BLNAU_9916 [Blattamonas nauphoetae]|uniref:Uncharacterized protein n=1 Tax=Blattamonas nauphoetae TaxID=2049346 RepID=A0ABQ9XUN0_9EUKA|nr:hypothetical protein BLNAU_9916 [Blattamonas nauphoetae]